MEHSPTNVGIIGAGLAGLSLAIHLKRRSPSLQITVIERKAFPYPEATHKVGESTVELAAHYFSEILGLKEHLMEAQLRKLGLRLFFTAGDNEKIQDRLEMGSDRHFFVPTYQIDRGRFENFLVDKARELGVEVLSETKVATLTINEQGEPHTITLNDKASEHQRTFTWVVDASGRAGLLKRQLGLTASSEHDSNAVWFRIKGRVDIDDWNTDPAWKEGKDGIYSRWYSTNHLTGSGYWVWLIPLASGYTSIGIVTDPKIHPLSHFRSYEDTLAWLRAHEPQCARELEPFSNAVADFIAIKHYAHKCSRVLSGDRWAVTGDAGVFIDPLYSPGSDFIAIQNGFIVDAIVRDTASERFVGRCEVYNDIYKELTEGVLSTFHQQYPVFGNPHIMPLKVIWDYTIYWGFLAFVAVQQRFCDLEALSAVKEAVARIYARSEEMQKILRDNNDRERPAMRPGMLDLAHIPFLLELNRALTIHHTDASFGETLDKNLELIEAVFCELKAIIESPTPLWTSAAELVALLRDTPRSFSKAA